MILMPDFDMVCSDMYSYFHNGCLHAVGHYPKHFVPKSCSVDLWTCSVVVDPWVSKAGAGVTGFDLNLLRNDQFREQNYCSHVRLRAEI